MSIRNKRKKYKYLNLINKCNHVNIQKLCKIDNFVKRRLNWFYTQTMTSTNFLFGFFNHFIEKTEFHFATFLNKRLSISFMEKAQNRFKCILQGHR
jgi:hypothetical protein